LVVIKYFTQKKPITYAYGNAGPVWDRDKNVAGLNRSIGPQLFPLDNCIPNDR